MDEIADHSTTEAGDDAMHKRNGTGARKCQTTVTDHPNRFSTHCGPKGEESRETKRMEAMTVAKRRVTMARRTTWL